MARTKKTPVQHVDPGYVSTRSDTGRMHKPKNPSRWSDYNSWGTGGLTPWSAPAELPIPGSNRFNAMIRATRDWKQTNPRPAQRVPSLQELARRNIPGLAMFAMERGGGGFRPQFLNPQHTRPKYPKGTFSH